MSARVEGLLKLEGERAAGYGFDVATTYNIILHSLVALSMAGFNFGPVLRKLGIPIPRLGRATAPEEGQEMEETSE